MCVAPETSTSVAEVTFTEVTGPLWWSILNVTSPVAREVTIIRLSSPPLTMTVLLRATHRLRTGAICSLKEHLHGHKWQRIE